MVLVPLLTMLTDLEDEEIFPASISIILPVCVVSLTVTGLTGQIAWAASFPYLLSSAAGGILAGLLTAYLYCRKKGLIFAQWLDIMLPPVAVAQGFGRLGCFMAGCCYGLPTDSCLGVVFPAGSGAPAGIPLWPTQLFSAGGDFLIAAILLLYDRKEHPKGQVGILYLLLYAVGRFAIEFFRNDPRGNVGFLSTSQFISVFMVIAVVIYLVVQKKRKGTENNG